PTCRGRYGQQHRANRASGGLTYHLICTGSQNANRRCLTQRLRRFSFQVRIWHPPDWGGNSKCGGLVHSSGTILPQIAN
ncbi:MAG: hypothetical protein KJP02_01470, partial [Octadecabacter sp.]|nr:hypothetical protein [Octadecabacter sp.]